MEHLADPEYIPKEWDEPIMADDLHHAKRECRQKAKQYTEQGRSNVELIDTVKASTKTKKRYICRFRS